jgi:hypothetical protein
MSKQALENILFRKKTIIWIIIICFNFREFKIIKQKSNPSILFPNQKIIK